MARIALTRGVAGTEAAVVIRVDPWIDDAVAIAIFGAVRHAVAVGVRKPGVRLAGIPDTVAVRVLDAVGDAVVIAVRIEWVHLAVVARAVVIEVLAAVAYAVAVAVRIVRARALSV